MFLYFSFSARTKLYLLIGLKKKIKWVVRNNWKFSR